MNAARAYDYVIAGGGSAGCVMAASVMPSLPRANTNLAVMIIAEKLAANILLDRSTTVTAGEDRHVLHL